MNARGEEGPPGEHDEATGELLCGRAPGAAGSEHWGGGGNGQTHLSEKRADRDEPTRTSGAMRVRRHAQRLATGACYR